MATRHDRERRMLTLLLVVVLSTTYVAYALTQPIAALKPTVSYRYSYKATPVALHWPAYGAAAVGAVGYSVLATHGTDQPIPTASTIKVLTALAVLNQKPLTLGETGPTISITQADIDSYNRYLAQDGSVVGVALGEELTEYDALEALLLPSANNIAETLARWAFGSIDAFNLYANQYASELGMTSTTVTDPSGFTSTTMSTPHDLVLLGEAAMNNPIIAEIAGKPSAEIPVQGTVNNVNFLLGQNGVVGLKTGNNDGDPGAFLAAAKHTIDGAQVVVISVIMNGPNLWTTVHDSLALLQSIADGFIPVPLSSATSTGTYNIPWKGSVSAVVAADQHAVLWRGTNTTGIVTLSNTDIPSASGQHVGTLRLHSNVKSQDILLPIVLQSTIPAPDVWWRLTHPQ